MTGAGTMTRGIEVTRGRKHDPSFHDLDDLSADEEVSHLYAMYLTDRLAACGSKSVRSNGLCESLFR
jgi:hypothetical protein